MFKGCDVDFAMHKKIVIIYECMFGDFGLGTPKGVLDMLCDLQNIRSMF